MAAKKTTKKKKLSPTEQATLVKKLHDAGKKSWETRRFNLYMKAKKRSDAAMKSAATRKANKLLVK